MGSPGEKVGFLSSSREAPPCSLQLYQCNFRGYPLKKIQENNESEIMQTVLDDAKESYAGEIVVELTSERSEDLESNVDRILQWIKAWQTQRDDDKFE